MSPFEPVDLTLISECIECTLRECSIIARMSDEDLNRIQNTHGQLANTWSMPALPWQGMEPDQVRRLHRDKIAEVLSLHEKLGKARKGGCPEDGNFCPCKEQDGPVGLGTR